MRGRGWWLGTLAAAALLGGMLRVAPADDAFQREVLPILAKHCGDCHGDDEPEAALRLTTRDALLIGSRAGHIVAPGNAAGSLLTQLVLPGSKPHMPPEGQLAEAEIAALAKWIDSLPAGSLPARPGPKREAHWAYQPLARSAPPAVRNADWPASPLDAFILARLEAAGLEPSPAADRATLLRRVSLDLTGLPPAPEEVEAFLADESPDAYERVVDRLLASPAYGERWGRHWLDLARYADSGGFHDDLDRPHAWRYRDYVIRSLNADKPYGQFLREQLAGDEIAPGDADALIATGFCRNGPSNDNNMGPEKEKYRLDQLDDVISTASAVFLGQTIGCARCHDHKYDPISQQDYYRFLAIFDNAIKVEVPLDEAGTPGKPEPAPTVKSKHAAAIMALADAGATPRKTFVLWRGEAGNRGPEVQPGVPAALSPVSLQIPAPPRDAATTGRRRALADWLAAPEQALTWRVIANRLWQHHFGRGLSATPSNFGATGAAPTHPELLDWLAGELLAQDGRLKRLQREIVASATYRQASRQAGAGPQLDPDNRLWWRTEKRRLEAEAIRDSILAVAGTLNRQQGGPGVKPRVPAELLVASQRNKWPVVERETPAHWRRGVYIYVKRQLPLPMLELFDLPSSSQTCERRDDSTVPTQALVLMNDPFLQEQAGHFAERVRQLAGDDRDEQARQALTLALARPPSAARVAEAAEFLRARQAALGAQADPAAPLTDLCHVLFSCNEFLYGE